VIFSHRFFASSFQSEDFDDVIAGEEKDVVLEGRQDIGREVEIVAATVNVDVER